MCGKAHFANNRPPASLHCCNVLSVRGFRMWFLIAEMLLALFIIVFIMWWTMRGKK
jgi:hypothetical protein